MTVVWKIRQTFAADQDFENIITWTAANFGSLQAQSYADTVTAAITALADGPDIVGAKARPEIGASIRTLHVARSGRKGRHCIVFRASEPNTIDVLRLLHDSMDLPRHGIPGLMDELQEDPPH